jgi:hypothetical protein
MNKTVIDLCHCGHTQDDHNFRHLFTPKITLTKFSSDDEEYYEVDAKDWEAETVDRGCAVPHCSAGKSLHGSVIKHEYVPANPFERRRIRFKLPLDTLCRVCGEKTPLSEHKSLTHAFTTRVDVLNRGENDTVRVKGVDDDQFIVWNDKMKGPVSVFQSGSEEFLS